MKVTGKMVREIKSRLAEGNISIAKLAFNKFTRRTHYGKNNVRTEKDLYLFCDFQALIDELDKN